MMDAMKVCPAPTGAKKRKSSHALKYHSKKYPKEDVPLETSPEDSTERTERYPVVTGETQGEHREPWVLVNTFTVRPPVSLPFLMGCTLGHQVMIRDLWSDELFTTDLSDGTTREAFPDQLKGDVFYCIILDQRRMAYCDSRSGLLHVCTKQGEHLKTIAITHRPSTHMYHIAVDRRGRVVYGVRDGKIFIIDPQDGKIVSSFSVDCKIETIAVTTSGHIVIKSGVAKFNVIRDGVIVHSVVEPSWSWAACVAHPEEDIVFLAYVKSDDDTRRWMRIMRPSGEVLHDDIFQDQAPSQLLRPSMSITDEGDIVLCDNGKLLVYRQNH